MTKTGIMRSLFVETQVKRVLSKIGFEARPMRPLDLRGITDNPIHAAYLVGHRVCVLDVPLAYCRGMLGFAYSHQTLQPFVQTVRKYIGGSVSAYKASPLQEYYEHFRPGNVWELLGLDGHPSPALLNSPPFACVLPWEPRSLEQKSRARVAHIRQENTKRGADLTIDHGDGRVGPISLEKGELEFRTLVQLTESIRKKGYLRTDEPDGDVLGTCLIDPVKGVRFLVWTGKHRIAVLAALGFEYVPLRISFVRAPRLTEAAYWPHVRNGLFTLEQATSLFDRIFDGRPPPNAIPPHWLERPLVDAHAI
jgi:hypothetical protein